MHLQIELWQLVTLLIAFFGACGAAGKLLLDQTQRHLDARFNAQEAAREANQRTLAARLAAIEATERDEIAQWQRMEREMLMLKADLPLQYVRRDDYIRGQSVIEAKLDGLAHRLENVQLRASAQGVK